MCVVDGTAGAHAARRQAAALASGGTVESIAGHSNGDLVARSDGADLLVMAPGDEADRVIRRASCPVLLSRRGPAEADLAERILVVVDDEHAADAAADIAGRLASDHRGAVTVVQAPELSRSLARATAAVGRIVLDATGDVPHTFGERLSPERAILAAVRANDPTLLVLPLGNTDHARRRAAQLARLVSCSVMLLPDRPAEPAPAALDLHENDLVVGVAPV